MKKYLPIALAVLVVASLAEAKTLDRVACVVNDQVIALSEVEARAQILRSQMPTASHATLMREATEALVAEKLFDRALAEMAIDVAPNEVELTLQGVMQQNGFTTEEQLREAVERQGLDWGEYRETIRKQLAQMKLLRVRVGSRVKVSEDEVKRRYAELAAAEKGEEELNANHLLVPVKQDASPGEVEAARKRAEELAEKGRELGKLADAATKVDYQVDGGDLGWFRRGELLAELEKAAWQLQKGEISEPVRTRFGWHVVEVADRRSAPPVPFEEVAEKLREALYREEMDEQTRRYVDELRRAAVITYPVAELAPPNRS